MSGEVKATGPVRELAEGLNVDLASVTGTGPGGAISSNDVYAAAEAAVVTRAPQPGATAAGTVWATPRVRNLAAQLGVDLSSVSGTGAGGRIRTDDVHQAAGRRPGSGAAPRAALPRGGTPSLIIERPSFDVPYKTIKIDAYSRNPFLDDLLQIDPEGVAAARAHDSNVPGMFSSGDVPLYTAAGFDAALVLRLPWSVRHLAAGSNDSAEVARIFEQCGDGTMASVHAADRFGGGHEGLRIYEARLKTWFNARHVVPIPKAITIDDWLEANGGSQMTAVERFLENS